MKLTNYRKSYLSEDNYINFHKNISEGFWVRSDIYIVWDKFVQYQKDIIQDFFADLINNYDFPNWSQSEYQKFIKHFEFGIEDLNSKLSVFGQKVKDSHKLEIRWIIEIIYDNTYLASLIWSTSLVIYRDEKLYFSFDNQSENHKIDLFSEFIEWDLHNLDKLVLIWTNLWDIVDDQDLENITDIAGIEDKNMIDIFEDLLTTRVTTDYIKFVQFTEISIPSDSFSKNLLSNNNNSKDDVILNYITKNKYNIFVGLASLLCFVVTVYLIYSFYQQKQWITLVKDSKTSINFTIQDLQKDISFFQKLDPASPDKIKIYKEINNKIKLLEQSNKLPNDIFNLKKLLQDNYLQSFNIMSISTLENKIYSLTQNDINHLGKAIKLSLGKNNYNIWGTKWSIIWIVSDTVLWNNIKPNSPITYIWCSSNIQKNWLYCRDSTNNIYNISKWWASVVTNKTNIFPKIDDIWVYGNNNMYILSSSGWIASIFRYQIIGTNQNTLKEPLNYPFDNSSFANIPTKLAVDWSFLFWNIKDKSIYQVRRDTKANLNIRQVSTKWNIDEIAWGLSTWVQIFSFANSANVYIRDPIGKSITTYRSNPIKSNDWNQYTYSLTYLFRLNIQIWNEQISDIAISDWLKPEAYILKSDWIYNIPLYQFLETYINKQNTQT